MRNQQIDYFTGLAGEYRRADAPLRIAAVGNPHLNDPMARLNQSYAIHDSLITGREGFDYSNPATFAANVITRPDLRPAYGLRGDTPASVARNIAASAGSLGVGV